MKVKKPLVKSKTINKKMNTTKNLRFIDQLEEYFNHSKESYTDKVTAFMKYVPRQRLTDFLSAYEIFKKVLNLQGSVIDCGVYNGRKLMTYAQLSAILEPMNYQRQVIGFDTFNGFPGLSKEDEKGMHPEKKIGGYKSDCYEELLECIKLFDSNRSLSHIPKAILVKGNAVRTIPKYIEDNPHLVVSLLSLDFSLYEPTKAALKYFLPRMPKGAVITFAEANCSDFSGEVKAIMDQVGIRNLRIERNSFDTVASFAVLK